MGLVDDDYLVLQVYAERVASGLVQEEVVRQKDELRWYTSVFGSQK